MKGTWRYWNVEEIETINRSSDMSLSHLLPWEFYYFQLRDLFIDARYFTVQAFSLARWNVEMGGGDGYEGVTLLNASELGS